MFTAASFTQSPKSRNNPLTNEWINGTQLIHTMEYYSAIKKEALILHDGWALKTSRSVKEASPRGHVFHSSIYMKCPKQANPETESRWVVARGSGEGRGMGSDCSGWRSFLLRWWKCSETSQRQRLHNIVNVINATELFTLKWWIFCYVDFASMKTKRETQKCWPSWKNRMSSLPCWEVPVTEF